VKGKAFARRHGLRFEYIEAFKFEPRNPPYKPVKHLDFASVPFTIGDEEFVDGCMWYEYLTGVIGVGKTRHPRLVTRYIEAIICHEVMHGMFHKFLGEEWSERFDCQCKFFDFPKGMWRIEGFQCKFSYPDWENLCPSGWLGRLSEYLSTWFEILLSKLAIPAS